MTPKELEKKLRIWNPMPPLVTPLQARQDMGDPLGIELLLKREDHIDDLGSGHKKRKLNYLHQLVVREGFDVLITAGSLPSGQCVAVAAAARAWGIRSRLIYLGDIQRKPDEPSGNYLNATLLADRVDWFESTGWHHVDFILSRIEQEEQSAGAKPFVVAPGIPVWPAILGSVELGLQLFEQLKELPEFCGETHILALAGTGGTCAGLRVASALLKARWRIHGICMHKNAHEVLARIDAAVAKCAHDLSVDLMGGGVISLHELAWGGVYGSPSEFELESMLRLLRDHGLPLDPNYMLKVFLGFESLVANNTIKGGDRVVVVHSGGSVDFVAGTPRARTWLSQKHAASTRMSFIHQFMDGGE